MPDLTAAGRDLAREADRLADTARDLAARAADVADRAAGDALARPVEGEPGTTALIVLLLACFLGYVLARAQGSARMLVVGAAAAGAVAIGALIASGAALGLPARTLGFFAMTFGTAAAVIGVGMLLRGSETPGDGT